MSEAMMELIPNLPEEIGLECLFRLSYKAHRVAARVCRRWRELIDSREFYYQRKQSGNTHKVACLIQSLPVETAVDGRKPVGAPAYGVSVFNPSGGTWERLEPVPDYPLGLPLFCQLSSVEGKLVLMGGWNPARWEPVKDVFIYDFTAGQWRRGKDMPSKRSFFATGALEERIFVAGGHDENKTALKSAWVYDVRRDEWEEISEMTQERDECEGVVIGNEFWVVSGYSTENQGVFEVSAECYEMETDQWRRVEGAWAAGRCPRACVGVGKEEELVCWADSESVVRVGACAVGLGEQTLVTGSAYLGAPQGVFLVGMKEGQNGKLEKIDVPTGFSGFVQSGCCVEI
ncbi:PREDICTED: F-box/kelch-repeat protein At1g15670-like [Nelumbo nucifera]|uniref:F-box/kelch-repeat protein At1g15670-like n=2 Tax=Nelumbo nucifera TaxID=4432 RepID=A0A1U8BI34_NELNU|nr:PREDICTED: F-box/kelch-repeat protein At1g15670-like [Nelumbo nucifera]DAD30115.1 TPA_asm: hypothetical protein HUJ06_031583 [Nelumbo nucifera]